MQKPLEQTNSEPAGRRAAALRERIEAVQTRIAAATQRAGRGSGEVGLIAVSKTHPAESIRMAHEAGLTQFGENRVQEALPKIEALGTTGLSWHLIGHLQRNKAREVAGRFGLIHSVDSPRLIAALDEAAARAGVIQPVLLQISLAGETQKSGAQPDALPALLAALAEARYLRGEGLMTVPPYDDNPEASRPYFRALRKLLEQTGPAENFNPRQLSMGMSGDFEVAIEEGSTWVRVGTAIFGERP